MKVPTITIRESSPADAEEIAGLLANSYASHVHRYLTYTQRGVGRYLWTLLANRNLYPSYGHFSAVDEAGVLAGFAEFRHAGPGATILTWLAVDEKYRGRGIGSQMLRHGTKYFARSCLQIDVFDFNHGARRLYDNLGFKYASSTKWYAKALPATRSCSDGLHIASWHEAAASLEAYGFAQLRAIWKRDDVSVGLLGTSVVRLYERALLSDTEFLDAMAALFPERQEVLCILEDDEAIGSGAHLLLTSMRLSATKSMLS